VRDLDLRGAGDLLGEQQTAHIKLIGADLYRRLLDTALGRARGDEPKADWTPEIHFGPAAIIPEDYVPEPELRLNIDARLARLRSMDEVDAFAEEIEGRFGQPPQAVEGLLAHAQAKILCREHNIAKAEGGPRRFPSPSVTRLTRMAESMRQGRSGGRTG
jgi:transcription-repair coupling factor (superfamily II helicase)